MRVQDYNIKVQAAGALLLGLDNQLYTGLFRISDLLATAGLPESKIIELENQRQIVIDTQREVVSLRTAYNTLTAGSPENLNEFIEVLNRFLANENTISALFTALNLKAPLAAPAFTGNATTEATPVPGDSSKRIPNTEFVTAALTKLFSDILTSQALTNKVVGLSAGSDPLC